MQNARVWNRTSICARPHSPRQTPPPAQAPPGAQQCMQGLPDYESQNPNVPGRGTLLLTICDMGRGPSAGDFVLLQVQTGPYAGYSNGGFAQGNLTVKE